MQGAALGVAVQFERDNEPVRELRAFPDSVCQTSDWLFCQIYPHVPVTLDNFNYLQFANTYND